MVHAQAAFQILLPYQQPDPVEEPLVPANLNFQAVFDAHNEDELEDPLFLPPVALPKAVFAVEVHGILLVRQLTG